MKGTSEGLPAIPCCSARLVLPHVRKRWPFPWFFWKEVVNSSFTAPRWDSFANALFNQEQGDHRDGLCGREPGWLGSLWRAAVPPAAMAPYHGHSLLEPSLPPHCSWSHRCRFPVWEISLQGYHLRSGDVSDSHQSESCSKRASSQLWQDSWPSLYFFFFFFSP